MTPARFVAIHGHFYQPPRENPWLERVEVQDSAAPHHDWNARVAAECYAPNSAAQRVDPQNRIVDVVNNFAQVAFERTVKWPGDEDVIRQIRDIIERATHELEGVRPRKNPE